jgi:hypothetical protein
MSLTQVRQILRRSQTVRNVYHSVYHQVHSFRHDFRTELQIWRDRNLERRSCQPKVTGCSSVEFTIAGRNDEYEPGWSQRLESVLAYNRALFASSNADFRVAFVEWNPLEDRPLLSPHLVQKFPFLRAIVVAPSIHAELCQSKSLVMMLNFSLNAAVRTSQSDFILISGGDVFLGRGVARAIRNGLRNECLYRAVRVDIRRDLDFLHPDTRVLESRGSVVRINRVDTPPYYNACGDFILMDRASLQRVRGFDEGVRGARLSLDSRCCATAMALGLECRLIGHVYHIDHGRSHVNTPLEIASALEGIPYRNLENWGLRDRTWTQGGKRLEYVS